MTDQIPGGSAVLSRCVPVLLFAALATPYAAPQQATVNHAERIVVYKKEHKLELLRNGSAFKKYEIALGTEPLGPKAQQGDHKTPEGTYIIDRRNAQSRFYRALHISYPNEGDRQRALKAGVPTGGDIMIHGLPDGYGWVGKSHRLKDWTDGCIAVTNHEMDEIWKLVPDGTRIDIYP
jgi:murein L,D-transpeptidase YafK